MATSRPAFSGFLSVLLCCFVFATSAAGEDWPMWRYDPARSAASPADLPAQLHLQWVREYPGLEPAWEDPVNQDRMPFDRVYEPAIMGSRMFVGSNRSDRLLALDTRTGEEKWRFYAGGPVRLPPAGWKGKVYFVSDDGYLYCLSAETGKLIWKFRGGPGERKVLGNGRLISSWCARGGPVIEDGVVYFSAGIWPFMGIFIHALDAETGGPVWVNDGQGSQYMNQPHNAPSFAGVAPQGALAAVADKLLVPGGRSVPACFDRKTGELLYYHLTTPKQWGGSHVSAMGKFFFNHRGLNTGMFDLEKGDRYAVYDREANNWDEKWETTTYPVLENNTCYLSGKTVSAYDLRTLKKVYYTEKVRDWKTKKMKTVRRDRWEVRRLWEFPIDATGAMIKAGGRVYVGGEGVISGIEVSSAGPPRLAWTKKIKGTVGRMIAGAGRLFVVTLEGRIYAFGSGTTEAKIHPLSATGEAASPEMASRAEEILQTAGVRHGYCLAFALRDGKLIEQLVRKSDLHVIAADPDPQKVARMRRRFDDAGLYGVRISVHVGDPMTFEAPPYLAALTVFEDLKDADFEKDEAFLKRIYRSMRPYGGVACLPISDDSELTELIIDANLPGVKLMRRGKYALLTRAGPLPGSADWTHQYGDIANTAKSDDKLVKAPLGLLWFGGNTHHDVLPRHGHGPPEQVIGGRLFIQGVNMLSARDVYTGRVLWKREFPDLQTFGIYYDESYRADPLDTTYNQGHIAGANARGTNYVAAPDKVYLAAGGGCLVLDPVTGETIGTISLPSDREGRKSQWGYIGVHENLLVAGSDFVRFSKEYGVKMTSRNNHDFSSSRSLAVMDRNTGKVHWRRDSKHAFGHNAIAVGAGKLFCIDALSPWVVAALKRRGRKFKHTPELLAVDVRTGELIYRRKKDVFGTWLGYSREHDILLQSGRASRDMIAGEPNKRMIAHRGATGEVIWDKPIKHSGPCMLHGDTIYLNAFNDEGSAVDLLTGEPKLHAHPLTGEQVPWGYQREYGCNSVAASEYLLLFRSGAAGFYDLLSDSGTGNLGGFKSGCTSNLVAANGVLNAPDYTRTCTCPYQNQTSLGLIHDPDVEVWTFSKLEWSSEPIRRIGINLGAPGDRRAESRTLWLDYPSVGGPSPDVPVRVDGDDLRWFRGHSSRIEAGRLKWVAASGVEGLASVTVTLVRTEAGSRSAQPRSYTVRLCFAEPTEITPGERIFDVAVQGRNVLENFDIAEAAGGPKREVVKQFEGIDTGKDMSITFAPKAGVPLLCGIEIIAE